MRQKGFVISFVIAALASFLVTSVASADFTVSGQWYSNRGPTVNIPPGRFDGPCAPATSTVIAPNFPATPPIPLSQAVAAPCARHQDPGIPAYAIPPVALAVVPQFGVPANIQNAVSTKGTTTVNAVGATFQVPAQAFQLLGNSQIPVPGNPVVQQLDTTFIFAGPATNRVPTVNSNGGQNASIPGQSRLMQQNAWSGAGQPSRALANFTVTNNDSGGPLGITRRVTYTAGANGFGGTMGMLLNGVAVVYVVTDLVTAAPGNEVLVSPIGNALNPPQTLHIGRGYNTTQNRVGNSGVINLNYNIPTPCTGSIPPSPLGCDLMTGISGPVATLPAATTINLGFPWTTGHVSAYAKGVLGGGIPQTSTLTAQGSDTISGGVRTIQLVAGGVALRNSPASGLGRTPHLDTITINVPEPGSTMALMGALGLIGGLYGVRRRLF